MRISQPFPESQITKLLGETVWQILKILDMLLANDLKEKNINHIVLYTNVHLCAMGMFRVVLLVTLKYR